MIHGATLVPNGGRAGDPVPLGARGGRRGLWLSIFHDYRIEWEVDESEGRRTWNVSTARYIYEVLDKDGREVFAYHWHPEDLLRPGERNRVEAPHLHLSSAVRPIELGEAFPLLPLADLHLRTGRVLIEDVVELLIEECGVVPLRDDWRAVVAGNRGRERAG